MARKDECKPRSSYDWMLQIDEKVRAWLTTDGEREWLSKRKEVLNKAKRTPWICKWTATQKEPRDAECVFEGEYFKVYLRNLAGRDKGFKALTVFVPKK